jgi:hypothetical protein
MSNPGVATAIMAEATSYTPFGQCCHQALCSLVDNADKRPEYIFIALAPATKAVLAYFQRR